ncbi:hypothetical protein OROHE_007207 [Orobanche hederae]
MAQIVNHEEEEATLEKYLAMVSVLPKERGWLSENIHLYQGFWYSTGDLLGLLILQKHFQAEPTDILLASYPKSGTTWLKALIIAIANNQYCMQIDHPLLNANPHELIPYLESYAANNPTDPRPRTFTSESEPSNSLMNTHIPYTALPASVTASGCRIVYVFRNPKDVLVSYWHFGNKLKPEGMALVSLEDAFEQFRRGASAYGSYWDHVLGYWKASVDFPGRVLFLSYEELKKEALCQTRRLSEFLGHPLDEVMVKKVVDFCSFEKLSNLDVNKSGSQPGGFGSFPVIGNEIFFRKGQVGDYKNHLTREMMDKMDEITKEKFKGFPELIKNQF